MSMCGGGGGGSSALFLARSMPAGGVILSAAAGLCGPPFCAMRFVSVVPQLKQNLLTGTGLPGGGGLFCTPHFVQNRL